ncbi:hypothetical protein [Flagellimonas aequoris]|nr:hypothetical protein [Allomuricauda aequoris]TXK03123.1 hypothetical protein FQ019_07220 [Allomuricauda aequoris]
MGSLASKKKRLVPRSHDIAFKSLSYAFENESAKAIPYHNDSSFPKRRCPIDGKVLFSYNAAFG